VGFKSCRFYFGFAFVIICSENDLNVCYFHLRYFHRRPSDIVHGDEQWYDLELDVATAVRQSYPICFTVDAFADVNQPGTGNPAGVVLLEQEADGLWMQTVAQEFNHSETAFVWPKTSSEDVDGEAKDNSSSSSIEESPFHIRYFTPTMEVQLCGHATLASASILYQTARCEFEANSVVFYARDDVLTAVAAQRPLERSTVISMTFPTKPATPIVESSEKAAAESIVASALNIDASSILFLGLSEGLGDLFVEITHDCFSQIGYDQQINIPALLGWDGYTRGVIVCCVESTIGLLEPSNSMMGGDSNSSAPLPVQPDFLSRFFGPKAGIAEDPVTGSAHCALAPYFCSKLKRDVVTGKQVSRRGGIVECEMVEDGASVKLTGTAVTTISGTLWVPGR